MSVIVWFRRDLRLADNPALFAAAALGEAIIPTYIYSPEDEGDWAPGGASKWWLDGSLRELDESLRERGLRLIVRRGPAHSVLTSLAQECGAKALYWNRLYDPALVERDTLIKRDFVGRGLKVESFQASVLLEPWQVKNLSGRPFQVFTAFYKAAQKLAPYGDPLVVPRRLVAPLRWPKTLDLDDLALRPKIRWDLGFAERFKTGEAAAKKALKSFVGEIVGEYATARDLPAQAGTSRLSAALHFGEISPRQIWASLEGRRGVGVETYRREIFWREFAHHLIFHFPTTPNVALRADFRDFAWKKPGPELKAWQEGRTGYPIVDAGLRELWHTGWMHNRVRMIAGSFLVKDLLLSWQEGARWFWDTLVDADLAANTLGWQWVGGCGADAAPFFRVFNPVLQGQKFDADGAYVRAWVPELASLSAKWIHCPWEAPADELQRAGVELGRNYPHPIVDHGRARDEALAAFRQLRAPKN